MSVKIIVVPVNGVSVKAVVKGYKIQLPKGTKTCEKEIAGMPAEEWVKEIVTQHPTEVMYLKDFEKKTGKPAKEEEKSADKESPETKEESKKEEKVSTPPKKKKNKSKK